MTTIRALGVDIGGTNTVLGLIDGTGTLLRQESFPTNPADGAHRFVARLADTMHHLLRQETPPSTVDAIGIACPAVNTKEGIVDNPANLGWGRVDLAGLLRQHFAVPIALLNDGDAAALGELHFGVAKGLSNMVMITLGTGMGGGIVVDGDLVRGTNGTGGEIGHVIIGAAGGRRCACGRLGCAETYVSATGICRTAAELLGQEIMPSPLRDVAFSSLTAARIASFARDGDRLAQRVFDVTGNHLGRLLANLAAVFDPQAIVLYGGLVHAGELLLAPTLKAFNESVLERYAESVKILVSTLNDGRAPILGAGSIALRQVSV